jgi:hypothetical protein
VRFRFGLLQGDGTKLANLRQAIAHLAKFIPKAERDLPQVLTASNIMTKAAEQGGPVELARIATLLAIKPCSIRRARKSIGASANSRAIDEAGSRQGRSMSRWRTRSNWLASRSLGCTLHDHERKQRRDGRRLRRRRQYRSEVGAEGANVD